MTNEELTKKVFDLDERVARHAEQIKTCFSKIGDLAIMTENIQRLAVSVELLAHEQKDLGRKVDGLSEDLEEIKGKPAKRWDSVVMTGITVIITALITYALAKAGF